MQQILTLLEERQRQSNKAAPSAETRAKIQDMARRLETALYFSAASLVRGVVFT